MQLTRNMTYRKSRETFHQWSDGKENYGINFATPAEADAFARAINSALNMLKDPQSATGTTTAATYDDGLCVCNYGHLFLFYFANARERLQQQQSQQTTLAKPPTSLMLRRAKAIPNP